MESIDVWDSDGRHHSGGILQVVPPHGHEDINGKATIVPADAGILAGCPVWTYAGSQEEGVTVAFVKGAKGWNSTQNFLKNVNPVTTSIYCEDKSVAISRQGG